MISLNQYSENVISATHCSKETACVIRECISRYAYYPDSASGMFWWLGFRLQNAIRNIFDCSDWNLAYKTLCDQHLQLASNMRVHILGNEEELTMFSFTKPQSELQKNRNKHQKEIASMLSSQLLTLALEVEQAARQGNLPKCFSTTFKDKLKKYDVLENLQNLRLALEGREDFLLLPE